MFRSLLDEKLFLQECPFRDNYQKKNRDEKKLLKGFPPECSYERTKSLRLASQINFLVSSSKCLE